MYPFEANDVLINSTEERVLFITGWIIRMVYITIKRHKKIVVSSLLFIVLIYTLLSMREDQRHAIFLPSKYSVNDFKPLQPEIIDDFPTISGDSPRIPHIIHQTYRDTMIPTSFKEYVKTFIRKNPDWTYYFWTDESARRLIAERHPYFLSTWDNYRTGINRADALRYIILYEFGGIYADLDVESIRPLDRATMKYACILPSEPIVQGILRLNLPFLINNAIMLCRPKHPFLKQMLNALPFHRPMADQIDLAGPCFVTSQFLIYNNISGDQYLMEKQHHTDTSPYFYTGSRPDDDKDSIYVPNTRYFLDTLDTHYPDDDEYHEWCTNDFENLSTLKKRACADLQRRGYIREQSPYTFTKHHWSQTYFKADNRQKLKKYIRDKIITPYIDIRYIVPECKIY